MDAVGKRILVVGSVSLDVLSDSLTDDKLRTDPITKTGEGRIEVGGTGYNIAINLAVTSGLLISFYTAMNGRAISQMIVREMENQLLDVHVVTDPLLPDPVYSAHYTHGRLHSAVSSIGFENHFFELTSELKKLIKNADWIALDCHLSLESLKDIMEYAKECDKPISVSLASVETALKLADIPTPNLVFGNINEYIHLLQGTANTKWAPSPDTLFCITNGAQGAVIYHGSSRVGAVAAMKPQTICNHLGAGDAFCAGTIQYCVNMERADSYTVKAGMNLGANYAAKVLGEKHRNLGTEGILDKSISDWSSDAHTDELTKLINRKGGEAILKKLSRKKDHYTLVIIDIDEFKKINDSLGHSVGDKAIAFVADAIKTHVRENDYAVRWGGDEFIIILPSCDLTAGYAKAERLLEHVRAANPFNVQITVSIGLAYNPGFIDKDTIFENADQALFQSKELGRNRITRFSELSKKTDGANTT